MAEDMPMELSDDQLENVAGGVQYTVKTGDTLWSLAQKYHTTVEAIAAKNKKLIKDINHIEVGWKIEI